MNRGATTTRPGRADYVLLGTVALLLMFGLQALFSSSFALAMTEFNDPAYFILRQLIWAILGTVLMIVTWRIPYWTWRRFSGPLLVGAVVALVLVLMPGTGVAIYGAQRWINLGPLPPLQPSEFVKIAVITYFAALFATKRKHLSSLRDGLLPILVILAIVGLLVMMQPDMGTTIVIVGTVMVLYFLAGAPIHYFGILAGGGVALAVPLMVTASYRASRLEAFFDPWKDPQGKGFHIIQALIAIGSGGWTGRGFGGGLQKFYYLPSAHTDAIFAVIAEELGFVGAAAILLLFATLGYRGFRIAARCPDRFGSLLAAGITTWFCMQATINIGGITQTIPFTGIPLPFISSGGSSLAATMAATGILLNISRFAGRTEPAAEPPPDLGGLRRAASEA